MKIKGCLILTLALAANVAVDIASAAPLTVAVYGFDGGGVRVGHDGTKITTLVTADLTTETNLIMLERAELSQELNEQAFGISGMVSSEAAAKIGKITGAQVLVSGQVIKPKPDRLVVIANIIGTETGRLFAAKVEGPEANLPDLAVELSRKIAQTITDQATNLVVGSSESLEERLDRVLKNIKGTNRPSVSISFVSWAGRKKRHNYTAEGEFGSLLLKAGFTVVDDHSDRKPDITVTAIDDMSEGPSHAGLFTYRAVIDLKAQARESGDIIIFDRAEGTATDASKVGADQACQVNAVDELAERVLPLLAK